jgi:hypothetical protein
MFVLYFCWQNLCWTSFKNIISLWLSYESESSLCIEHMKLQITHENTIFEYVSCMTGLTAMIHHNIHYFSWCKFTFHVMLLEFPPKIPFLEYCHFSLNNYYWCHAFQKFSMVYFISFSINWNACFNFGNLISYNFSI